jgi:polyphosphate glucokinase
MMQALGIDVGGTGIKGALVDLGSGALLSERERVETPRPATPEAIRDAVADLVGRLGASVPVGIALPGVIQHGVVRTAANIDPAWIGASLPELFADVVAHGGAFLNDADAQAVAEVRHGVGRGRSGLIVTVTFGTGIGVALVHDGRLIPNAELGHLEVDGVEAESVASARARKVEDLSWQAWGARATRYLQHLENLLWPDLFIVGGGIAKKPEKWQPFIDTRTPLCPAAMVNNAGIVGAALAAGAS